MKNLKVLIAAGLLAVSTSFAAELSDADVKWSKAVEQMIVSGPATISTPVESRAKLAQKIAAKHDRLAKLEKTEHGFRITVPVADKVEKIETATN